MDKPIEEWLRRFRGMGPDKINNAWSAKAGDDLSWRHEAYFHAASAERMKLLGHMAIDLDDETRKSLCRQADSILKNLNRHLEDRPEQWGVIEAKAQETTQYYEKYGSRTARYYMFEQGMIDELGDKKAG